VLTEVRGRPTLARPRTTRWTWDAYERRWMQRVLAPWIGAGFCIGTKAPKLLATQDLRHFLLCPRPLIGRDLPAVVDGQMAICCRGLDFASDQSPQ
jgi:hypothetical protein